MLPCIPRFIPAYAGNTNSLKFRRGRKTVHPRVCGEHFSPPSAEDWAAGSSPRMRGTLGHYVPVTEQVRFIPAYAGNTLWSGVNSISAQVHPRVCGEHDPRPDGISEKIGSSPRMRGTRPRQEHRFAAGRFIPAYAGNTFACVDLHCLAPVHPRVCGEHIGNMFMQTF